MRSVLIVAMSLAIFACGELRSPTAPPVPDPGDPDPSATFTRVQSEIFTPYCAFSGCHGDVATQEDLELSTGVAYGEIVGVPSNELPQLDRIEPGSPMQSYLYLKVTGSSGILGARMPLGQPPLTAGQIELLRNWIERGAPND